jgi:hypothetical protein
LKTGVTVLLSGVLGLGKNDGPDTTLLEGVWVVDVEGVSIGGGYSGGADGTVADRGREEIGTLVDCGVELVNGRNGAGRVGWDSGNGWAALEAFAAASLA